MIKLRSIHIEEFRGIKELHIPFGEGNFAIGGPNGSGKSGIIDAIEFALTGKISRLQGAGTKEVSVLRHGPHVDQSRSPEKASVRLDVFIPKLKKTATITRTVKSPQHPIVHPRHDDIISIINECQDHSEIVLSRRDLLRLIHTEPGKRSEQIQALLKLDKLDQMRSKLTTVRNKLRNECANAEQQVKSRQLQLRRDLGIDQLNSQNLLRAVNDRRSSLSLQLIRNLDATTQVDAGVSGESKSLLFDRSSANKEIKTLINSLDDFPQKVESTIQHISGVIRTTKENSLGRNVFKRLSLVESGLEIVNSAACPLCDLNWPNESELRNYLEAKLRSLDQSKKIRESFQKYTSIIGKQIMHIRSLIGSTCQLATRLNRLDIASALETWISELAKREDDLYDIEKIDQIEGLCANDFLLLSPEKKSILKRLSSHVETVPDTSVSHKAHTFLVVAQSRLVEYRKAKRLESSAKQASDRASSCYGIFCDVLESVMNDLYKEVQQDFCSYYRKLNIDDESDFEATLKPQLSRGKVMLAASFYSRGKFPPIAYHSEGHQDGMGVCLYLALMKKLFGERFGLALLDDVVMSIDSGHRKKFCDLLKTEFPSTQFVITTHDRLWMKQMEVAGLITSTTSIRFYDWTIDRGPLVESYQSTWEDVEEALRKDSVSRAAATLRHYLEFMSRELADGLAAPVKFRGDGRYDLGDLLPSVLSHVKSLYKKAQSAAQSWNNHVAEQQICSRIGSLKELIAQSEAERWAINSVIHYNLWTNFSKEDFLPVVSTYRKLSECLRCSKCDSWFRILPRINPEVLRCTCGDTSFTLKKASGQSKKARNQ